MECKCHSEFHTKEISAGTWPPSPGGGEFRLWGNKGSAQACLSWGGRLPGLPYRPAPGTSPRPSSCVWGLRTVLLLEGGVPGPLLPQQVKDVASNKWKEPLTSKCRFHPIKLLLDGPILVKSLRNESMALNPDYRCGWWREKQQRRKTSFQIEA